MEVLEAIYKRRAMRAYTDRPVERATVQQLLGAAVQAPSAINDQPWAFAVVQDKTLLQQISDRAKAHFLENLPPAAPGEAFRQMLSAPEFNIFYEAGTLIILCAKTEEGMNAAEDCCLAGQNLMLAACEMGLGTCPIGLARPWLNLPEVKKELGIPEGCAPVLPIILGYPKETPPPVPRRAPEILFWK